MPINPRIARRAASPYGGRYELDVPERGVVGKGSTFDHLVFSVEKYRRANGIPVGLGLAEEVEREVCVRYPDECSETDPRVPPSAIRLNYEDVYHGTANIVNLTMAGRPLESQEEADRRAAICAACPFKRPYAKPCTYDCGPLRKLIDRFLTGGGKTKSDAALQACGVCKCECKVIVWVPLEYQLPGLTDFQKEQYRLARQIQEQNGQPVCWKAT